MPRETEPRPLTEKERVIDYLQGTIRMRIEAHYASLKNEVRGGSREWHKLEGQEMDKEIYWLRGKEEELQQLKEEENRSELSKLKEEE
jgi:hypothetical protein